MREHCSFFVRLSPKLTYYSNSRDCTCFACLKVITIYTCMMYDSELKTREKVTNNALESFWSLRKIRIIEKHTAICKWTEDN